MLQDYFQDGAYNFGSEFLSRHKFFIDETNPNGPTGHVEAQSARRTLGDGFTQDLQHVSTTRFERFYAVPG